MKPNYVQCSIDKTGAAPRIVIYTNTGAASISNQFATAKEVASIFNCSKATAYRIMKKLPNYEVEDLRDPHELHMYNVVSRQDVTEFERTQAGNPNFGNPVYQRKLAKRPRKKQVDR